MISKETIINHLKETLQKDQNVIAMWLEGSDGTGSTDEYSDLDLVIAVEEGSVETVLYLCEESLLMLSALDLSYEESRNNPYKRYKVFHLVDTPAYLLLDINVQSLSECNPFVIQNKSEVPSLIFDKREIVQYIDLNEQELKLYFIDRLYHLENMMKQKSRVEKYVRRGKFIEAIGYYQKFIISPLIEMLRIKYKPINHDYYIMSISKHLPGEVVTRLEGLYKVNLINEIDTHVEKAQAWFHQILAEVRVELVK